MKKGCRTRGEGETKEERELQRPRQVVLLSFQNLVFPTSYFRLEGRGKVKEDLEIPPDRGETNRKKRESQKELIESIKSQLPLLLPIFGCKVKISGSTRHTLNLSCPHKI